MDRASGVAKLRANTGLGGRQILFFERDSAAKGFINDCIDILYNEILYGVI